MIVRKGANIKSLADLKGKRVSIDEPGSGTLVNARAILGAAGVTEKDIKPEYLKQQQSADKLKDGSLDAYFQTTGYPQGTLTELATTTGFELLAIDGEAAQKLKTQYKFFADDEIPDGTYKDVKGVNTVRRRCPVDHVGQDPRGRRLRGHEGAAEATRRDPPSIPAMPRARRSSKANALTGLPIPLHPGAEKFYKEAAAEVSGTPTDTPRASTRAGTRTADD